MSALGQKQILRQSSRMSTLPPKADIVERDRHVRFVPKAVVSRCSKNSLSKASLLDHLVGATEQRKAGT
jgi:hypothetical protein